MGPGSSLMTVYGSPNRRAYEQDEPHFEGEHYVIFGLSRVPNEGAHELLVAVANGAQRFVRRHTAYATRPCKWRKTIITHPFQNTPKTTFDAGKTTWDVGKIMSDIIQTTSDLF